MLRRRPRGGREAAGRHRQGRHELEGQALSDAAILCWGNGHEAVVKLLFDTGKVDVDSKGSDGRTQLSWAAENVHEAVVKLLQSSLHSLLRSNALQTSNLSSALQLRLLIHP